MRTLLPVFDEFKLSCDMSPEEPENFAWLNDDERSDFELARAGLDSIPGSRENLKNYTFHEDEVMPFSKAPYNHIVGSFGNHHSGASITRLAWIYKSLLNDWNGFVLSKKGYYAQKLYDARQLNDDELSEFYYENRKILLNGANTENVLNIYYICERLIKEFCIEYSRENVYHMLNNLQKERADEADAKRADDLKEWYDGRIQVLKHHYKFPSRWSDTPDGSSLFGSIDLITPEMMADMELIYPDYREHIAAMKQGQ